MSTTRGPVWNIARQPYDDRIVRLNSDMVWARDTAVETLTGSVVFGAALYDSTIWIDRVSGTGTITDKRLTRIGGGWDRFRTLTRSNLTAGDRGFDRSYALRDDGALLLVTTRGGALYTVRIPLGSPMKPIVKQVRARTRTRSPDTCTPSVTRTGPRP